MTTFDHMCDVLRHAGVLHRTDSDVTFFTAANFRSMANVRPAAIGIALGSGALSVLLFDADQGYIGMASARADEFGYWEWIYDAPTDETVKS